jgi:hypothetical protein
MPRPPDTTYIGGGISRFFAFIVLFFIDNKNGYQEFSENDKECFYGIKKIKSIK